MKKKNILVFGASGFIGTYLIEELFNQNYQIIASDNNSIGREYFKKKSIPYINIDITNKKEFENIPKNKYDVVIILAALQPATFDINKNKVQDYFQTNVIGTLHILDFCRNNKVGKVIYACSHRNTSGLWQKNKAIKEIDGRAQRFNDEYAMFSLSESAAQDCLEYYSIQFGLKNIIFRLPPVYGYGPHLEIFKNGKPVKTGFQTFIENAIDCKPLKIWGDSERGRDIIYVKDVVSAFLKAIVNITAEGLYNISSGKYLTLKEEVETIAKVFWCDSSKPVIIEQPEKALLMDSFLYDNSKAKRELDWAPQYNFEDMLMDYQKEKESNKFNFLIEKRKKMFQITKQ